MQSPLTSRKNFCASFCPNILSAKLRSMCSRHSLFAASHSSFAAFTHSDSFDFLAVLIIAILIEASSAAASAAFDASEVWPSLIIESRVALSDLKATISGCFSKSASVGCGGGFLLPGFRKDDRKTPPRAIEWKIRISVSFSRPPSARLNSALNSSVVLQSSVLNLARSEAFTNPTVTH